MEGMKNQLLEAAHGVRSETILTDAWSGDTLLINRFKTLSSRAGLDKKWAFS
jgi:hypothetical protein